MVDVPYSYRIVIDYDFIKWLSSSDKKISVISHLLRINKNSRHYKNKQVVILPEDYKKLCEEGIIKDKTMILGCLFPMEIDEEIKERLGEKLEELPVELRRGILAVSLTGVSPFKVALFSTKTAKEKYKENGFDTFSEAIDNLSLKNEEESLFLIEKLFRDFTSERERYR